MRKIDLLNNPFDTWYCCQPDFNNPDKLELCKIRRDKVNDSDSEYGYRMEYSIICYYDGRILFTGSLAECKKWINEHWIEKRYLDNYGKK